MTKKKPWLERSAKQTNGDWIIDAVRFTVLGYVIGSCTAIYLWL